MSLSKTLEKAAFSSLEAYFTQLYFNPIRTKSLTSCTILLLGNLTSQRITGQSPLNRSSLLAYGLYGLLFGGTIPHYYFQLLEKAVPRGASLPLLRRILIHQLLFTPLYQLFALYMLTRLEGGTHLVAVRKLMSIYLPVLLNSWKWLTLPAIFNFSFVPPMLRVLFMNLVGFFWTVYLATVQRGEGRRPGPASGSKKPAGSGRPAGSGNPRRATNTSVVPKTDGL